MADSAEYPRYRIALDCDPGRDDAMAILAALGSPALDVELITTVTGNVSLERATANALLVVTVAHVDDVPVHRGADRPLRLPPAPVDDQHGDLRLPDQTPNWIRESAGPADEALRCWLGASTSSSMPRAIIATGPLTNLGLLLQRDPAALDSVDAIYVMGGTLSRQPTRISLSAEFNFFADPDAAMLVLSSGRPVYLVDYDASTSCQIPTSSIDNIAWQVGPPLGDQLRSWLRELYEYANRPHGRQGIAIHDLYAVACAAGVPLGRWERHRVSVDTSDESRGTIMIAKDSARPETQIARELDADLIERFLVDSCRRLNQ